MIHCRSAAVFYSSEMKNIVDKNCAFQDWNKDKKEAGEDLDSNDDHTGICSIRIDHGVDHTYQAIISCA